MKFRKVIESGIITAALAVSSVTTAVSASAAEVDTTGVVGSVLDRASQIASTGIQSVQITHQNAQAAAAAAAQAAEWANKMLVTVDENSSLNIRKEASQDAEVVGKFYHGSGAEVLEVGAEWTKVKSGDVEGYVSNAYCVFGEEARVYAEANCETQATANADGIRVRESYSTDAKILDVIDAGESLKVNTDAESADGWVSVECNGVTAYVAAAYVDLILISTMQSAWKKSEREKQRKHSRLQQRRVETQLPQHPLPQQSVHPQVIHSFWQPSLSVRLAESHMQVSWQ